MTEAEAKTKWCPRTSSDYCIASDCMMWVTNYTQDNGKLMLTQIANDIPDENHRLATPGEIQEYDGCFEAGKPIFAYIQYATGHCGLINK